VLDTIATVGSCMPELHERMEDQTLDIIATWKHVTEARSPTLYVTGEPMLEVYAQTLFGGVPKQGHTYIQQWLKGYESFMKPYRKLSLGYMIRSPLLNSTAKLLGRAVHELKQNAMETIGKAPAGLVIPVMTAQRKMAKTTKGYIGLFPGETEPGDSITLFSGAKVPFGLREHSSGFQLLGEAYVHGIMDDETWDPGQCKLISLI
jgi:hypothetical protein